MTFSRLSFALNFSFPPYFFSSSSTLWSRVTKNANWLARLIACTACTARFACALHCAHLFACSLTHKLVGQWDRWLFLLCFFSVLDHSAFLHTFSSPLLSPPPPSFPSSFSSICTFPFLRFLSFFVPDHQKRFYLWLISLIFIIHHPKNTVA